MIANKSLAERKNEASIRKAAKYLSIANTFYPPDSNRQPVGRAGEHVGVFNPIWCARDGKQCKVNENPIGERERERATGEESAASR